MVKTKVEIEKTVKAAVEALAKEIAVDGAFLFGSYATGTANEDSDIDIAVFSSSVEGWPLEKKFRLASRIKRIDPYIELHIYSGSSLKEARPSNFYGHILETGKKVA
ncbi:MAG: nucleotidyltransferase domain-containing protein [Nitrospirae bacterium]|nr:nucleotidyltransferase domain-containing protein [Nitrospirota bacterium]